MGERKQLACTTKSYFKMNKKKVQKDNTCDFVRLALLYFFINGRLLQIRDMKTEQKSQQHISILLRT